MRGTALGLGVGGAVVGLFVWLVERLTGDVVTRFHAYAGGVIRAYAWGTLLAAIVALVGGGLAVSKPRVASVLLLIAGVGGFFSVGRYWTLSGALLLVAALLAFLGRNSARPTVPVAVPTPAVPAAAMRSDDGQWWWDGTRWQPVQPGPH